MDADNLGMIQDDLTEPQRAAYHEQIGAITRVLNGIRGPWFGPLTDGDPAASWRTVFTGMLEDLLHDGERRASTSVSGTTRSASWWPSARPAWTT